jgi:hypothetical protein
MSSNLSVGMGHTGPADTCKRSAIEDYGACYTPFSRFLAGFRLTHFGLAWEGSPVASQHSYGGLSSGLPVSSRA